MVSPIVNHLVEIEKNNPDRQIAVLVPERVKRHGGISCSTTSGARCPRASLMARAETHRSNYDFVVSPRLALSIAEGITGFDCALGVARVEPLLSLCGTAVRECFRTDTPSGHLLQAIVSNGCCGSKAVVDVVLIH